MQFGVTGGWLPTYWTFLVATAFVPAFLLYRTVGEFVNGPAFSLTLLWVMSTSIIWEVTLGVPGRWWATTSRR